jgi:hypothetical protein
MAWATPQAMERLLAMPTMSMRLFCKKPMEQSLIELFRSGWDCYLTAKINVNCVTYRKFPYAESLVGIAKP